MIGAIIHYQKLRESLRKEFDIEPREDLQDYYKSIKSRKILN
ncbi:hypothetical protein KJ966_31540 [bacterium]|nr:hypothetical protein [bacterium]